MKSSDTAVSASGVDDPRRQHLDVGDAVPPVQPEHGLIRFALTAVGQVEQVKAAVPVSYHKQAVHEAAAIDRSGH